LGREEVTVRKLFIAFLILACLFLALRWLFSDRDDAPGGKVIFNRVWVDHLPRGETDPVQVFVALQDKDLGVFERTSRWKGEHELFRFERRGDGRLRVVYPQTRQHEDVGYRAGPCNRGEFDYCLELRGSSRGARSYVSKKGWVVRSLDEAGATVDALP
jgi:hypothetical protein